MAEPLPLEGLTSGELKTSPCAASQSTTTPGCLGHTPHCTENPERPLPPTMGPEPKPPHAKPRCPPALAFPPQTCPPRDGRGPGAGTS